MLPSGVTTVQPAKSPPFLIKDHVVTMGTEGEANKYLREYELDFSYVYATDFCIVSHCSSYERCSNYEHLKHIQITFATQNKWCYKT